jgi:hypothetical protein
VTDTAFGLDAGGTKTLTADVLDSKGSKVILSNSAAGSPAGLNWSVSSPSATVVPITPLRSAVTTTTTNDATVTYSRAGVTSIVASCTPPNCNSVVASATPPQFGPVYSNIVTETSSGTTSTTVLVTGTDTTQLIPIPTSTNTPGTAITLSNQPNSLLIGPDGARAMLGSAGGLMIVDANALTLSGTFATVTGKVLAIAPDGKNVVVSDTSKNIVFVGDASTGNFQTFSLPGVTAAAFSSDGFRVYLAGSTSVTVISAGSAPRTTTGTAIAATAVTVHPTGSLAYFASAATVPVVASCNLARLGADAASVAATLV